MNRRSLLLVIFFLLSLNRQILAQSPSAVSSKLDSLYRARSYGELETYTLRTLLRTDSLNVFDQAELHKYLGIVYILQNREDQGREVFARWLKLDAKGYIDSFKFPPGIVQIYKEVKASIPPPEQKLIATPPAEPWKYTASRSSKSVLVPGWGQLIQGKSPQGYYLFAAQSAGIAGWAVSQHNFNLADRSYHNETEVSQFDSKYDKMNNWNKARWSFAAASLAVYIYAQTDFFLLPPNVKLAEVSTPDGKMNALIAFSLQF